MKVKSLVRLNVSCFLSIYFRVYSHIYCKYIIECNWVYFLKVYSEVNLRLYMGAYLRVYCETYLNKYTKVIWEVS